VANLFSNSAVVCFFFTPSSGRSIGPRRYSLYHINWCRLCIRVSAKKV
jgi:hypothetical protein